MGEAACPAGRGGGRVVKRQGPGDPLTGVDAGSSLWRRVLIARVDEDKGPFQELESYRAQRDAGRYEQHQPEPTGAQSHDFVASPCHSRYRLAATPHSPASFTLDQESTVFAGEKPRKGL